ncbi:MAG: hypothetical protein ACFNUG_00370 [Tannerella forsythia]|uniref:hypothetical protein n=1 Tax=Tannerella forsythia TaxID=28112 RepID=UPI00361A4850
MQKFKQHLSVWLFAGAATLFVGLAYTASDFFTAPTHALTDRLILFSQWLAIMIGIFPVFYLLSINKYVFASIYPLVCVLSGVLTYFRYTTGTIFTTMIFDAALDNDHKITQELISVWLILTMIGSLLAGVGFAVYRFRKLPVVPLPALHVVLACSIDDCGISITPYRTSDDGTYPDESVLYSSALFCRKENSSELSGTASRQSYRARR